MDMETREEFNNEKNNESAKDVKLRYDKQWKWGIIFRLV